MNAIQKALTRLERGILAVVKEAMQRQPEELAVFTGEYLRDPSDKSGLKKSKRGNLYFSTPNTTTRLRTLYGNITRATQPDNKGNISETTIQNGLISVEYGYDPNTSVKAGKRTTTLKYAVINENRGRPFITPGFKAYMNDAQGYKALLKELDAAILELV